MSGLLLTILKYFPIKAVVEAFFKWFKDKVDKSEATWDDTVYEILYKIWDVIDDSIPASTKIQMARKLGRK